jgi:hypothetical protein
MRLFALISLEPASNVANSMRQVSKALLVHDLHDRDLAASGVPSVLRPVLHLSRVAATAVQVWASALAEVRAHGELCPLASKGEQPKQILLVRVELLLPIEPVVPVARRPTECLHLRVLEDVAVSVDRRLPCATLPFLIFVDSPPDEKEEGLHLSLTGHACLNKVRSGLMD